MKDFISEKELWEIDVVNTHCHHWQSGTFENSTLHSLLNQTYVRWASPDYGDTPEGRQRLFVEMEPNSYFRWWKRAVEELYGDGRPLTPESWDWYDERVRAAYKVKGHDIDILKNKCRYSNILLDDYTNTGSDHDVPELMNPIFRIDWIIQGHMMKKPDVIPAGEEAKFAHLPSTFDEFVTKLEELIRNMVKKGCVGLKTAIAYVRPIDFKPGTRALAERAFGNPNATPEEIIGFGDFVVFECARIAGECDIPFQIHTGLGGLNKTRAIGLLPLIMANPRTKFDIFHGSYPWCDDVLGLAHNLHNVYIDLCWLPIISTSRAVAFLEEALDIVTTGRIIWGCDTWTSEESYGARMAAHHCIRTVLNRMIEEDVVSPESARVIARRILRDNAAKLYKLN